MRVCHGGAQVLGEVDGDAAAARAAERLGQRVRVKRAQASAVKEVRRPLRPFWRPF
jgi:hypothetical protein